MESLTDALIFVNGQIAFHERKTRLFEETNPRRFAQHTKVCEQFAALAAFLQAQAEHVDKLEDQLAERPAGAPASQLNGAPIQLSLRLEDIQDLPDELIRELSITDGDKMDFTIQGLMQEHGGIMSLDQLLIGLYRKTGEIHKRPNLNARLYRMTKKNAVFDVPGRKGVYSVRPLSEGESAALERPVGDQNS